MNSDERTLEAFGLSEGSELTLKDLGPQISWRAVFLLEYLGPLLIHQLFYALHPHPLNLIQQLAYVCVTFHFLKREYETLFVHRFSHATMPLRNLFKNSAHYWLGSGLAVAWELYNYKQYDDSVPEWTTIGWACLFMAAELGNLYTHVVLRRLRSHDPKARGIPYGFGFHWVSCPNYLFESIAWLAFAKMTDLISAWIFLILATAQMYLWARKKHDIYRKEFPNYPRERKAMFPYIL